jgi:hypothetical protein
MRNTLLVAIAVATLAAGTAQAQVVGGSGPSAGGDGPYAGGSGGVEIVTDFPPVKTDIVVADAGGTATETLSCEWTEPQDDDRQCLRFQSDPQVAFAKIEESGGVRADQHTVTEGADMTIAYSKRSDGTWLIRSRGTVDGKPMHFGRVCTADGQRCVRWDADGATAARSSVRAAAAKLRKKR